MMSKFERAASCLSAVTEVIRQMGTVHGRVRIQKTAYFLHRLGMAELADVEFFYHHYGPFSRTVAESVLDGMRCDALHEDAKPLVDDRQAYAYQITKAASDLVDDVLPASRELVESLIKKIQNEHWRTLELASTIDFLEQRENLSREVATTRALGLKPACREYEPQALRLLDALQLPNAMVA